MDWMLAATGGVTYTIEVTLDTLSDSTVTILDSSGQRMAYDDDGGDGYASYIEWTAPAQGVFTIQVEGYGTATGSFTLIVGTDSDPCSGGVSLAMTSGNVFFSNSYDNGATCSWTITCPNANDGVTLSFVQFDTEAYYDFVDVYDGGRDAGTSIFHESGSLSSIGSPKVVTANNVATIEFTSDGSVGGVGFDAEWVCSDGH
jgi:hypothetical protein